MNGNWGEWTKFGACSETCGTGSQTHSRICNNPSPGVGGAACSGDETEENPCNITDCPGLLFSYPKV